MCYSDRTYKITFSCLSNELMLEEALAGKVKESLVRLERSAVGIAEVSPKNFVYFQ